MFFEADIEISLSLSHPFSFRLSKLVQWSKLGTLIKRDMKMQGSFGFFNSQFVVFSCEDFA